jgi:rare lipoprotein A
MALLVGLVGCQQPVVIGNPHFVLGEAWQAEGVWHYPFQSFELNETGLASVYGSGHPGLTTNGEVYDSTALTAAHQTLQLPAIIRLTNLDTGLQTLVRINDRGPSNPARMLAVTPRVAALLQFPSSGVARVRLEVLQAESREAADRIQGGDAAKIDVSIAPRAAVQQETLAPPAGARDGGRGAGPAPSAGAVDVAAPAAVSRIVQRLPETVTRVPADPGTIWLRLGSFSRQEFARIQMARIGGLGATIERVRNGRTIDYRVSMGPYSRVPDVDEAFRRVVAAGINDPRIVIE